MKLSPPERAHQLREYGRDVSYRLKDFVQLADPDHQKEIVALSARIFYCNDHTNNWVGENLYNRESDEHFDGFGRYWHCSSKLCSYCTRLNAKRNRHALRFAINQQTHKMADRLKPGQKYIPTPGEKQGLSTGEHYRFITMTVPNLGLKLEPTRKVIDYAWSLLRKRLFFVRSVVGGAKAEEFTRTRNGYHYHYHILARTKAIDAQEFRAEWSDCVKTAYAKFGYEYIAPTSDNLLWVKIKIVHDLKQVANEVCKYITKADSWTKMPVEDLLDIALVRMWPRMFELFGSFRNLENKPDRKPKNDLNDGEEQKDLFADTSEEAKAQSNWRILIQQMPLDKYLQRLKAEVDDTIARRSSLLQLKFPFATIRSLDDS